MQQAEIDLADAKWQQVLGNIKRRRKVLALKAIRRQDRTAEKLKQDRWCKEAIYQYRLTDKIVGAVIGDVNRE